MPTDGGFQTLSTKAFPNLLVHFGIIFLYMVMFHCTLEQANNEKQLFHFVHDVKFLIIISALCNIHAE